MFIRIGMLRIGNNSMLRVAWKLLFCRKWHINTLYCSKQFGSMALMIIKPQCLIDRARDLST